MPLWQPKSGPLLTAKETEMCQRMVARVIQSSRFIYKYRRGRKVKLCSEQVDTHCACSSYESLR